MYIKYMQLELYMHMLFHHLECSTQDLKTSRVLNLVYRPVGCSTVVEPPTAERSAMVITMVTSSKRLGKSC